MPAFSQCRPSFCVRVCAALTPGVACKVTVSTMRDIKTGSDA
jgi:hypothetical protein